MRKRKVLISNNIYSGEKKYYLDNDHKIKLLHIMLPKTSTSVKNYDGETKWMYILIENDYLLEICNTIWDKFSAYIKKKLIANLSKIKKYLKTKIKFHGDEVRDFYHKEILQVGSYHTCLAVISLDSALLSTSIFKTV